jgi:hypothetical protein
MQHHRHQPREVTRNSKTTVMPERMTKGHAKWPDKAQGVVQQAVGNAKR